MTEEHHFQHDADQTELEKWLNAVLSKAEPYSNQILMGFIAATVIAVVGIFWLRSTGEAASAGWTEYVANEAPDDYKEVAEEYPDTPVATWAQLQAGRLYLSEGLNAALSNRETSDKQLNNAKDSFETILKKTNAPAAAREEALAGLASTLEALSDSDTGPAIKAYEELLQEFPETTHGPWAQRRIEALKTGEAQNFYAWFRKQNPQPTDRPKPKDVSNPAEEMLKNLELTAPLDSAQETPAEMKNAEETPAAPELPPVKTEEPKAEEKPATPSTDEKAEKPEEKKADSADKPASEEKPATEEKPVEDKSETPAEKPATEEAKPETPAEEPQPETPAPAEAE